MPSRRTDTVQFVVPVMGGRDRRTPGQLMPFAAMLDHTLIRFGAAVTRSAVRFVLLFAMPVAVLVCACSSYSPSLHVEPSGRSVVYALDLDRAQRIVYGAMSSSFAGDAIVPLPSPLIGYETTSHYALDNWSTRVTISPVSASVEGRAIQAVRIEVGGGGSSFLTGRHFYDSFKDRLRAALDSTKSLRIVASFETRSTSDTSFADPSTAEATRTGTAFAVVSRRSLLTAFHVVDEARSIDALCANGQRLAATLTKVDPANDLALLSIAVPTPAALELSPDNAATLGERVFTIGFPVPNLLGPDPKYSEGTISALSGPRGSASLLQISVPLQPGNSGGPLSDASGRVVGVVTSTASIGAFVRGSGTLPQNVNWATRSEYVRPLLSGLVADNPSPSVQPIQRVQESICLVVAHLPRVSQP